MKRENYQHLIGRRYVSGAQDCYGLARDFYRDVYGLELLDLARPEGWWNEPDFDLISDLISEDGWKMKAINPRMLKEGDGLIFSLLHNSKPNHIGIYVGNSLFIHHVYGRSSIEEALLPKWTNRLLMVVEHDHVIHAREAMMPKTEYQTLLPDHVKRTLLGPIQS